MKKGLIVLGLMMMCLTGWAQESKVDSFLECYHALVVMVEAEKTITDENYEVSQLSTTNSPLSIMKRIRQ